MYVSMYVMYVCIFVCIYVRKYVIYFCMYLRMQVCYLFLYVCTYACMYTYKVSNKSMVIRIYPQRQQCYMFRSTRPSSGINVHELKKTCEAR
jgi:hypothetical protein